MDTIDEFESMFRRAEREPFVYHDIPLRRVALVTDGTPADGEALRGTLQAFIPAFQLVADWETFTGEDYHSVVELTDRLVALDVDLVVTYRHLQEKSVVPQHSLGVYLDVLTQVLEPPVLVLPGTAARPVSLENRVCRRVMVVTDHISGDSRLINYGVALSSGQGEIWLCHVEDDAVFERYMRAFEKIPAIDSDTAREELDRQLLADARHFIDACLTELREKVPNVEFQESVSRGHRLREFVQLVESQDADLLVVNTKDQHQLAMHGMAYALSVEMIDRTLLLL